MEDVRDPWDAKHTDDAFERNAREEREAREADAELKKELRQRAGKHPGWKIVFEDPSEVPFDANYQMRVTLSSGIELKPFNFNTIGPDFTCGFFGKRRTGKSFLMRNVLYHMREFFARGFVFTNTPHNGFWQHHFPRSKVFKGYQEEVLMELVTQQEKLVEFKDKHPEIPMNINVVIVLDDIIDQKLRFETVLERIFYNGRHLRIFIMIAAQYVKSLHTGVRANTDLMFTFIQAQKLQREAIATEWVDAMEKKDVFQMLDVLTPPLQMPGREHLHHAFLAIDTSYREFLPSTEMLFIGKAADPGPFAVGDKSFWKKDMEQLHQIVTAQEEFMRARARRPKTTETRLRPPAAPDSKSDAK